MEFNTISNKVEEKEYKTCLDGGVPNPNFKGFMVNYT
jgi:hypothetical protein